MLHFPSTCLTPYPTGARCGSGGLHGRRRRTNEAVFDKRKGGISKGSPWWDAECDAAAQTVHSAPPGEAKDIASAAFRSAVRKAKRSWANGIIRNGNLWEAAKWRHGRRVTKIPSVRNEEGFVHSPGEMANVFENRFFSTQPPRDTPGLGGRPPRLPGAGVPPAYRGRDRRAAPEHREQLITGPLGTRLEANQMGLVRCPRASQASNPALQRLHLRGMPFKGMARKPP